MELKDFGKYLKYKSFQQALHRARRKSYDCALAAERSVMNLVKEQKVKAKLGAR